MSKKIKAPLNSEANKFKTLKQAQGTKVVVHTEILTRTNCGHLITNNSIPNGIECIIICKADRIEIEIENMIDNYLKGRIQL